MAFLVVPRTGGTDGEYEFNEVIDETNWNYRQAE
jgi:hypothetical protein